MWQNLCPKAEFSFHCPNLVYVSYSINSAQCNDAEFAFSVQIFQNPLSAFNFCFFQFLNIL